MPLSQDVQEMINNAAARFGVSSSYLSTTALMESSGNVNAATGSAQGLFQFMPDTAAQYGLANPFDAQASSYAAAQLAQDNYTYLSQHLGRAPTDAELYLAHQQGAAGALGLLTHGSESAAGIVGLNAVTGNGGSANMTASDFVNMIEGKYAAAGGDATGVQSGTGAGSSAPVEGGIGHYFTRAVIVILGFGIFMVGLWWLGRQQFVSAPTVAGELQNLNKNLTKQPKPAAAVTYNWFGNMGAESSPKETAPALPPKTGPEIAELTVERTPEAPKVEAPITDADFKKVIRPRKAGKALTAEENPTAVMKEIYREIISEATKAGKKVSEGTLQRMTELGAKAKASPKKRSKVGATEFTTSVRGEEAKKNQGKKLGPLSEEEKKGFAADELSNVAGDPLKDTIGAVASAIGKRGPKNQTGFKYSKAEIENINEALKRAGMSLDTVLDTKDE